MKTVQVTPEALPQNLKAVQTYNRIQKTFPSELHTATVVVKAAERERSRRPGRGCRPSQARGCERRPGRRIDQDRHQL